MAQTIIMPEWRGSNAATAYPFSNKSKLVNRTGKILLEGTFLDAVLYPVGGREGMYLSSAVIDHQTVRLNIGDVLEKNRAFTSFTLIQPPDLLLVQDAFGRPAGVLVSETRRLTLFQSWGVGTHEFLPEESEFCPTICIPTPEVGVRGFVLDDGSLFTGPIWMVGGDGVVLRTEVVTVPTGCGSSKTETRIRVDVVGDALFRRKLCGDTDLFNTPRILKKLRFTYKGQSFECGPDENGNIRMLANNHSSENTVLRITPTSDGVFIGAVGQVTGE